MWDLGLVMLPARFQPWNVTGSRLLFEVEDGPTLDLRMAVPDSRSVMSLDDPPLHIRTIVASPTLERFLVAGYRGVHLYDGTGSQLHASEEIDGLLAAGWSVDGALAMIVSQAGVGERVMLQVLDGEQGDLIDEVDVLSLDSGAAAAVSQTTEADLLEGAEGTSYRSAGSWARRAQAFIAAEGGPALIGVRVLTGETTQRAEGIAERFEERWISISTEVPR